MRPLEAIAQRMARSDMAQALLLLFSILVVVVGLSWPSSGSLVNESWFTLSPARNALLALAAALFGSAQGVGRLAPAHGEAGGGAAYDQPAGVAAWLPEAWATFGALMLWSLLTFPLEVVSHAASYPAIGLGWVALVGLLTVPAYFGLGLLLRSVAQALRISWILPILVPAAVLGLAWLDLHLDASLFNPWTATLSISLYPVVAGAGTLLVALALLVPRLRHKAGGGVEEATT